MSFTDLRGSSIGLALVCAFVLLACKPVPSAQQPATAVVPTTKKKWSPLDDGCSVLEPGFSSDQGAFRVLECHPRSAYAGAEEEAAAPPVQLRFQHLGAGGETTEVLEVDADQYSAITEDRLTPRFWDGHLVTVVMPEERGGQLVIGNWTGTTFVFTQYPYATGDEDGIELAWKDGAFTVSTVPEGARRLVTGNVDSAPGQFGNQSVTCSTRINGVTHALNLGLDTHGGVISLVYSSAIPANDDSSHVCLVMAARGNGESDWSRADDGDVTFAFPAGDDASPGGSLRIHAVGAGSRGVPKEYSVALDVAPAQFCGGQSDVIPEEIVLNTDSPQCHSVRMTDANTEE